MKFSDGEKLVLAMLCEIYSHLELKGKINPSLVHHAILGGHTWALKSQYRDLFVEHVDDDANVREVLDTLDMWHFIERGYNDMHPAGQKMVNDASFKYGIRPNFLGFDRDSESEHYNIVRFLTQYMGRYQEFRHRDVNAHTPRLEVYRRMLPTFYPMRATLREDFIGPEQIVKLFAASVEKD